MIEGRNLAKFSLALLRIAYLQAAAGMGVYGPRTIYCIAINGFPGCHEFLLQDDGKWLHVKETTEIGEGKMFSPGNLRATFDNAAYERLISYYVGEKYTLRYTGGMVPGERSSSLIAFCLILLEGVI